MLRLTFKHIAVFFTALLLLGCARTQSVHNINDHMIPAGLTQQQVKQAIVDAGNARGWVMRETSPGVIAGDIVVRSHNAAIDVSYSEASYSINYRDSRNLDYSGDKIHRNYNKWIILLDRDIMMKLSAL